MQKIRNHSLFFSIFRKTLPIRIFGIFLKLIKVFRLFLEKKSIPRSDDEMPLYRGYCQASRILASVFRKNIKNFPDLPVPPGARRRYLSDGCAVTRHPLYSAFFGKCSVKNRLSPKKNEKKSRTASFPWRTIFPRRIFAFFWKTLSKKPLFSEKTSKFFRMRPSRQVRDTAISPMDAP